MKTENQKWGSLFRVAIVGAATMKGKELKEVLEERNFPAMDIKLLDDNESLGQLDSVQEEVSFVQPVGRDQLENVDFTFFASDERFTRSKWKLARDAGSAIVDLSYSLESEKNAPVRSPWIERELGRQTQVDLESSAITIAHPAAVVLSLLLLRAQRAGTIRTAAATIFEPVSEQGRRGMDELHEQTVNLLSFQQMPTTVFGSQVAFNVIGRYGKSSSDKLETIERRIGSHVRQLLQDQAPSPALILLQAPVFHAHTFSIYVELEKSVSNGDFSQAIAGEHVELARAEEDAPSNVNVAGKDEILVSARRDSVHENGFWLWAAADNLRVAAITAVECATALAAVRPHGKVQ
ncbi:MAG TPA: Asd/ArgC dimerization domain-containing protein [Candidatus Angelobacter sp.]|nr:Asd/ArgC dimerization domain-containing protein [Candidatus Angelobacter sp.]